MASFYWTVFGAAIDVGALGVLRGLLNRTVSPVPDGVETITEVPTAPTELNNVVRQVTALDGIDYVLEFQWNERSGAWFLSVFDADEDPILQSKKIVVQQDLLHGVADPRRPLGTLICYENSGAFTDPGRETFASGKHGLYYLV